MSTPLTDAVPPDDDDEIQNTAGDEAVQGGDDDEIQNTAGDEAVQGGDDATATDLDNEAAATTDDDAADDGDEGNATDEDAAALAAVAAAEDDDDDRGERRGIPKSRFDEVNERRKSVETENQQLRQLLVQVVGGAGATGSTAEAATPRDFDAEYEALVDRYESGAIDEAKFRRDERKLNIDQAKAEIAAEYEPKLQALQRERERQQQAEQAEAWTKEVAAAIKQYPFLNHEGAAANQDAIKAVRAECEELIDAGIPAAKALRLAVRDVAPQYGEATPPSAEDAAAARRKKAREAVAAAENAQPAALGGAGNGTRVQGKQRLTASVKDFEKWQKVPEEQRDQAFTA